MKLKKYFIFSIAIICLFLILPMALGAVETVSVSNEAELLSNITAINSAVDAGTAADSYVIIVTNNITLHSRIYFHNAHITIQGNPGEDITITRGSNFGVAQDIARSWFNPGMLEVAVYQDSSSTIYQFKNASITLKNITFNDADNPDTSAMTNSIPASYTTDPSTHGTRIYDSILSAYHENATIILDEGAHLKNPGGWSAIYITSNATGIMKEGSSITGGKNTSFYLVQVHGANFEGSGNITNNNISGFIRAYESSIMFNGNSSVNNASGHFIYSDNTSLNLSGVIQYTKFLDPYSLIYMTGYKNVNIDIDGSIYNNDMEIGARGNILNIDRLHSDVNIYGSIRSNEVGNVIRCMYSESTITLHENSQIMGNSIQDVSVIYVNGTNCALHIKGLISINFKSNNENSGAVYLINNAVGFLYPTGEISYHWIQGSGGGVYVNTGSTFTMNGGTITGNTATGAYDPDKLSGNYGGGAVAISRNSTFIMNDGIITDNFAEVGGGVWVSGKSNAGVDGSTFIMNGGTIADNKIIRPENLINSTYGKEVAIAASENINNPGISSSGTNGYHIQVSKDAVIGGGFIGIAQTNPTNSSQISGYHQAVYPLDVGNGDMFVGTLSQILENDIVTNSTVQTSGYTKINQSLWISSQKTSGSINFVTNFSNASDNDYLVAIASLDTNSDIMNSGSQIEILHPSVTSNGLSIDITAVPSATGYGIVFFKQDLITNSSGGSGTGSGYISGGGKVIEDKNKPAITIPDEPIEYLPAPASVPIVIIQLWAIAVAVFVFIILRRNDDN